MRNLLLALAAAAGLAVLALAALVWTAERRASAMIEEGLRARLTAERGGFSKAGLKLLSGKIFVRDLRVTGAVKAGAVEFSAGEISLALPPGELLRGGPARASLGVLRPSLTLQPSTATAAAPEAAEEAASGPGQAAAFLWGSLPGGGLKVREGRLSLRSPYGGKPLEWEGVEIDVARAEPGYQISLKGRLSGEPSAVTAQVRLAGLSSPCESEGQVKVEALPVARIAAYFPPDSEARFEGGTLSLATQFNCKKGWLTASHLVEVKGFSVEVATGTKELFGVSVKYLKDLLKIEQLSFVVPMNGDFTDPHIGIAASLQQILLKILEGKFEDKEDAEKLARRGGDYFGKKLDKALKAWQKGRR